MLNETRERSPFDWSHNVQLLGRQLFKGFLPSVLVAAAVCAASTFYSTQDYGFRPFEAVAYALALALVLAYLKGMIMFLGYRIFYTAPFQGSFLIISLLLNAFWLVALVIFYVLASSRTEKVPSVDVFVVLMPFAYVVFSVVCWAAFHFYHFVFGRIGNSGTR